MKNILRDYEKASGQQIDIEKSAILFSTNTVQESIMSRLGISKLQFQLIKDRLWKRLRG